MNALCASRNGETAANRIIPVGTAMTTWVSEASVRAGFGRLEAKLVEQLRTVVAVAEHDERVKYLLLDVRPHEAFDGFPVSVWTLDSAGQEHETEVHGRELLEGEHLLDPAGSYPLGRADWIGASTMSDVALVERVMLEQLRDLWVKWFGTPKRVDVLAGVCLTNPTSAMLLDLFTGEIRALRLLGSGHNDSG